MNRPRKKGQILYNGFITRLEVVCEEEAFPSAQCAIENCVLSGQSSFSFISPARVTCIAEVRCKS